MVYKTLYITYDFISDSLIYFYARSEILNKTKYKYKNI